MSKNVRQRLKGFSKEFDSWVDTNVGFFLSPVTSGHRHKEMTTPATRQQTFPDAQRISLSSGGLIADKSPECA
jgi:hypothetical protein